MMPGMRIKTTPGKAMKERSDRALICSSFILLS
jgi:hypothetical protein